MSSLPLDPYDAARLEHEAAIESGEITVISRQRGQGVVDPRDQFAQAPEYTPQDLPPIFNAYVDDAVASWGGDPGAYACAFMAMHVGVLHSSVKMNTNPLKPNNFRNPNDFSLTLGKSGENKSGMFKDLTRHQETWQKAMTRTASNVTSAKRSQPPMCFLQNASIEGMMMQIADNRGERLLMGSEEAMSFYDGAALHHKDNAANSMSNAVCQIYDGGMFSKRLVTKAYSIPECLGTLIMTTTIDKIAGWKAFKAMVDSGLMARHTIGVLAHAQERNPEACIPGADQAMGDVLLKMRSLRDVQFSLAPDARVPWLNFTREKERLNTGLAKAKASLGLVNWCRKYDMRIMTMASILQAYDFIEGGQVACTESVLPATEGTDERVVKTVTISFENLSRAIDFVEGYLYDMQEFFYTIADGQTEFGMELLNFLAYRVVSDEPDNPDCRVIAREFLTNRGPLVCRGAITPEKKELHKRYVTALLDHGYIEPYDHPRQHASSKYKHESEKPWYKVRDEVFEWAATEGDWLKAHYDASRDIGVEGRRKRIVLSR